MLNPGVAEAFTYPFLGLLPMGSDSNLPDVFLRYPLALVRIASVIRWLQTTAKPQ